MRHRAIGYAMFLPLLVCILGADAINWGANQPVANPGGQALTLEGAGTYVVDPAHVFGSISLKAQQPGGKGLIVQPAATMKGNIWTTIISPTAKANYDCSGELITYDPATKTFPVTKTTVVNLNVN